MTPEQIMDALLFLHTAREQLCLSDPLRKDYDDQIRALLLVQKQQTIKMIVINEQEQVVK